LVGIWELILIFAIVLLIFGARRIPDIARGIGKGIREFRKALEGKDQNEEEGEDEKEP
jgi:sec-independent protein translocase protein TatA